MEATKKCFKCHLVLARSEFYAHPEMADGLLGKCKACTRKDSEELRRLKTNTDPEWVKKEAARHREKGRKQFTEKKRTPSLNVREVRALHKLRYPEKTKARVKSQRMKPAIPGNNMHHWSYKEEHAMDVIELTTREHGKAHRFLVYDQEHFQYRRSDTLELLDTRERHEAFIRHMIATKED